MSKNPSEAVPWPEISTEAGAVRKEQRFRRVGARMSIRISTIDAERDPESGVAYFQTSDEYSANVSRGGAFIVTPESFRVGSRLMLDIEIPGGSTLQAIGRVAWTRIAIGNDEPSPSERPGVGIEFTGGRTDDFAELERYLDRAARNRGAQSDSKVSRQPTT